MLMTYDEIMNELRAAGSDAGVASARHFGVNDDTVLGVRAPVLHKLAKRIGRNHAMAGRLWRSGVHEARSLAALIADPARTTAAQMERWVAGFTSWDTCDCFCFYLFDKTSLAWEKALAWSARDEEYVKRAGFALVASLAWHDKTAPNARFVPFFAAARRAAADNRNFVKKAVSWALRQMGKRNAALRARALKTAEQIAKIDAPSARWIASDVRRELTKG
jgi:3-methyladenine DNA glycosylase AlkD